MCPTSMRTSSERLQRTSPPSNPWPANLGVGVIITPAKDGSYTVDHSGEIFVIDPTARLAAILSGPFTVEALAEDWHHLVGATT